MSLKIQTLENRAGVVVHISMLRFLTSAGMHGGKPLRNARRIAAVALHGGHDADGAVGLQNRHTDIMGTGEAMLPDRLQHLIVWTDKAARNYPPAAEIPFPGSE
jgi:hypothetical protein